ncbi:hypothetical protein WH297_11670 [Ochrobactrum vermis]|uniref:Uncharacterized protein n=1 Tax=Ochrobactrum vermis TaxID=1827297 RepID=A0ABU8PG64_9HYPH|nr:hypothetical protein [Ochrobactrum vermis]PQZ30723.1 hypothetical protein CQZ93_11840 [Ochrobactrum vermis]
MHYSSQAVIGLSAILSIVSVQAKDMERGTRHAYALAQNRINTDEGLVFDIGPTTATAIRTNERTRRSLRTR